MKKRTQILLFSLFIFITLGTIALLYLYNIIVIPTKIGEIALWGGFFLIFTILINEGIYWIKNGKRSDWADLVAIIFIGLTVYLVTRDVMTSFMGAFSIYLLFGMIELKDYEVLNKILLITVISYNLIFIAGLLEKILELVDKFNGNEIQEYKLQDTMFSMSFFVILFLGFLIFGRRYMVVFRFLSAQYLTLVFYLVAWIGIMAVSEIAGEDFSDYIYYILIAFNILIYLFSGILLDWMMGYKKTDDPELNRLVQEVAKEMGLNPKRIKVRYGKYPILNAMAYGCYGLDMHMAIIAPDLKFGRGSIDKDEIRGVIAHEFAHLKGKHTLILTLLGSLQLIVYKLLGWPATFFDYSFRDDLPFDLWIFLLINFAISMVLYVFVRNLEARSDRAARKAGYKLDLAKGLYNLESYYATSHEIGLDATLLSDEKLTKNNRKLNYLTTASYLNQNMINPGKGTLLSNLINAHPPSYHRILAILHPKEIKPMREALLPFSLLSKKRAREFFNETHEAQKEYAIIATEKIKHEFEITDIRKEYKKINKRDQYAHKFGKTYAFLSRISQKRFVAQIIDIKYINDAANPIVYVCRSVPENKEGKEEFEINPMIYEEKPIDIGKHFYFKKHGVLRLESIDLEELYLKEKYKQKQPKKVSKEAYKYYHTGILNYKNIHTNERVIKPIFKTRIPQPLENLEILAEKYVFLKEKGTYLPLKKESMTIVDDFKKIQFKFKYISENNADPQSKQELTGTLEDYVIKFRPFYAQIHGDQNLLKKEIALFTYFMNEGEQILTILKKAVNSEIPGKIVEINVIKNEKNEISDETILKIDSIFSESHEIPINKIDSIFLQKPSMILEKKSSNSSLSKIFNKIQAKRHPERILYDIQPSNDKKTE